MSQVNSELPKLKKIEVPGPIRYRLVRFIVGRRLQTIEISTEGLDLIPQSGPVSAAANHRNNEWDVPSVGWALKDRRTPYYPAKAELNHGIKGFLMRGAGAMPFERENPSEEKRIYGQMLTQIGLGRMVLTMVEGTSKNTGPKLGGTENRKINDGALRIAVRNGLSTLHLIGLGGTETGKVRPAKEGEDPADIDDIKPTRIHIEIGALSLEDLTGSSAKATSRDIRDFHQEIAIPSHQEIIDIAYSRVATSPLLQSRCEE